MQDGAIYTPVDVGPLGCVLYSIEIPGGQAPAALVYRNKVGTFSYARPDQCVRADEANQARPPKGQTFRLADKMYGCS